MTTSLTLGATGVLVLLVLGIYIAALAWHDRSEDTYTDPPPADDQPPWCVACLRGLRTAKERRRGTCHHCDSIATGQASPWA